MCIKHGRTSELMGVNGWRRTEQNTVDVAAEHTGQHGIEQLTAALPTTDSMSGVSKTVEA